jgi:hypothetical protein
LNNSYGGLIESKNDTSVNEDSESEVDNLKDKIETEISFYDAPNVGKNKRIARALNQTSKLKSWFNPNPTIFIKNADPGR